MYVFNPKTRHVIYQESDLNIQNWLLTGFECNNAIGALLGKKISDLIIDCKCWNVHDILELRKQKQKQV